MPGAYLLNLITSSATITPGTEGTVYPRANLYDEIAAKVFRCTSKTALTILVDFGSNITADSIALVNHNLTASATLSLKAGAGNPPSTVIAAPAYRKYDLWKSFTQTTARYWLLTITDANAANIQIGQLLIGLRVALPRGRRIGESYSPKVENAEIAGKTYGGVNYVYPLYSGRVLNPAFRVMNDELAIFEALHEAVNSAVHPFLYIPDTTAAHCYYVRKESGFVPVEIGKSQGQSVWDYTMTLTEESRGLEVLA